LRDVHDAVERTGRGVSEPRAPLPQAQGDWWPDWTPVEPPTLARMLEPALQPIPVLPAIALALAAIYLLGWLRVRTAGGHWPWWRAGLFITGCALLAAVTGLAIEGYGKELFSAFMLQQMTIMIVVPPLLVLGAPGTLLLRALPREGFGNRIRALAVASLRARWARFLLHPGFAVPLFLATFYGLYFSDAADLLLATGLGHVTLEVLFLIAGLLFTVPLLSPDPLPRRDPYMMKLVDVFAEAAVHAFFGVVVMMAGEPLLRAFSSPPPAWDVDPLADQRIAGGIAWGYGEAPTVLLLLVLVLLWYRDDSRRARQRDRRVERHGDTELDAYNAYLEGLGRRSP